MALNVPVEVPPPLTKLTTCPELIGLLKASRIVAVAVTKLPETTVFELIEIVEFADDAGPGMMFKLTTLFRKNEILIETSMVIAVPTIFGVNVNV